jgi:hypothetical protein
MSPWCHHQSGRPPSLSGDVGRIDGSLEAGAGGPDNSWVRLGRLLWVALVAVAAVPSGAGAAESARVEVREVTVDVDRDLGSEFGGRVDVTVRFRVVNTSDETVQPTARIELESQIGGGTTSAPIELESVGPGDHVDVVRTAGSLLPFGSAHATVTVRAGDDVTTATASEPIVPWFLLVVVAVVLVLAIGFSRARRARSRDGRDARRTPAPAQPRA